MLITVKELHWFYDWGIHLLHEKNKALNRTRKGFKTIKILKQE